MIKERAIVLSTDYYKIVSAMVSRNETRSLLSKEWTVFPKYKRFFTKGMVDVNPNSQDEHSEEQRELMGVFSFSGEPIDGRVVLKYEVKTQLKQEYFSELLKILCEWAFSQDDVYSIQFDTDDTNLKDDLLKLSFKEENGSFILHKEADFYLISCAVIGLVLGMSFGGCFQTAGIIAGIIIGLFTGLMVGTGMDKREKVHRQLVEKENYREE